MEKKLGKKWVGYLTPHLIYILLAFFVTWPAWADAGRIIGGGDQPDWTGTAWAYWWTGHAFSTGGNPFDGSYNFFPIGQRPLAQYNLMDAIIAWPFLKIFGVLIGYNLFATIVAYSTAWGMHLLARAAGASLLPAIFAGVAIETSSFLLLELSHGRLSQAMLVFWLLGLAGVLKIARGEAGWKIAIGTGLCVALTSLTYWYWGLFLIVAAIPIWFSEIWFWTQRRWKLITLAGLVAAVICGPYVITLAMGYNALPGVGRELEPWMSQYSALSRNEFGLAMGIKQSHWPLWPLLHTAADPDDKRIALIPLIIGVVACFRSIPEKKRWIAIVLIGYLMTLGPYLKWTDMMPSAFPLPYLLFYDYFPFFERFWWPQRLELLVLVGLLVMGALWLERIRLYGGQWGKWIVIGAIAGSLIDVPFRNPYLPAKALPPPEYKASVYDKLEGPILTTPVISANEITRHILWMQTFHEQPILGGLGDHLEAHRPLQYDQYIDDRIVLRYLAEISAGQYQDANVLPSDVNEILEDGFVWAVVDPAAYSPGLEEKWAEAFTKFFQNLWGDPTYSDGLVRAWKITPITKSIYIDQIQPVEHVGKRTEEGYIPSDQGGTGNQATPPAPMK